MQFNVVIFSGFTFMLVLGVERRGGLVLGGVLIEETERDARQ